MARPSGGAVLSGGEGYLAALAEGLGHTHRVLYAPHSTESVVVTMSAPTPLQKAIAAFVNEKRAAATAIAPSAATTSTNSGLVLVSTYGFETLFATVTAAAADGDEVMVAVGAEALRYLLSSTATESLPDAAALLPALVGALDSTLPPLIKLALGFLRDVVTGRVVAPSIPHAALHSRGVVHALLDLVCAEGSDEEAAIYAAEGAADVLFALAGGVLRSDESTLRTRRVVLHRAHAATGEEAGAIVGAVAERTAGAESTVFIRIMAITARLCGTSDALFGACQRAGLVPSLLSAAVDDADPLTQLLLLDLLPPLASSVAGAAAILAQGTYAHLIALAGIPPWVEDGAPSSPSGELPSPDPLLGNSALACVSDMYAAAFTMIREAAGGNGPTAHMRRALLPGLWDVVRDACAESLRDSRRSEAALAALGAVAKADPSAAVELAGQRNEGAVREWMELGGSSDPRSRLAALATLARVLHGGAPLHKAEAAEGAPPTLPLAVATAYARLFDALGPSCGRGRDSVEVCRTTLATRMDADVRYAAADLLAAVVALPGTWGLRRVCGYPGLLETLTDREGEATKEGKEWRFGVVEAALGNEACVEALGGEMAAMLRAYRARGPFAADMAGPGVTVAHRLS